MILAVSLINNNSNKLEGNPHIANYHISGLLINSDRIIEDLDKIANDQNAKAIIITIDSPGGTTVSAEEIYLKLESISKSKPTVSVMKNIATSGAYLLALGTDHMIARENTITGSIGVIFQWARVDEGLEKIGIKINEVKSGELKAEPDFFGDTSLNTKKMTQELIDETYQWFISLVKDRRSLGPQELSKISDGRIISGRQAVKYKLIDEIGGQLEAKNWLVRNSDISEDTEILDIKELKKDNLIDFGLAKMINYFNINSRYSKSIEKNISLIGLDGLLSVWHHPK
tara:strand:+ start:15802 stop:16659 length:858 start_codon:yes stop_codon:yes gene_type:complete